MLGVWRGRVVGGRGIESSRQSFERGSNKPKNWGKMNKKGKWGVVGGREVNTTQSINS